MIKHIKSNIAIKTKIRKIIAASILAAILPTALAYSSYLPYYAFAKTQIGNQALSLSNLIKQGQPYQGSTTALATVIDFSDLQCSLCNRFVKATVDLCSSR